MVTYHLTKDGPRPCNAVTKPELCPYKDGGHFASEEEAVQIYAERMEKSRPQTKLKKNKKAIPETQEELIEYANSSKVNYNRVCKELDARLDETSKMNEHFKELHPESNSEKRLSKNGYKIARRDFNKYRDRTAHFVEAIENSKYHKNKYKELEDPTRVGKAVRVESFKPQTREWQEARSNNVGGSDVAALAIMDFTPEEDQTFFMRKRLESIEESKTRIMTDEEFSKSKKLSQGGAGPLYRGTVWEDRIRDRYIEDHPEQDVYNAKDQYARMDRPWQKTNFDGVTGKNGKLDGIIEIKTSGVPEIWDKGIPYDYRAQTLYYLNTTGLKKATVRVCINDTEHRDFHLKANDEVVPGCGMSMEEYINKRVEPWFKNLKKKRG